MTIAKKVEEGKLQIRNVNQVEVFKSYTEIILFRNGKEYRSKVDTAELGKILAYKWRISGADNSMYVKTWLHSPRAGKRKETGLHNFILGESPKGMVIDHINGDTFDNRRINLRFATPSQNQCNQTKIKSSNTSGYRGVHKKGDKWIAQIYHNNKKLGLGYFNTPQEAALAYNDKAIELRGEFASINDLKS